MMLLFGDLFLLTAVFTVYDFNIWIEDTQVRPAGVSERPLFGGDLSDDDNTINSNSEIASETLTPPSQTEQSDEGESTFGSEDGS